MVHIMKGLGRKAKWKVMVEWYIGMEICTRGNLRMIKSMVKEFITIQEGLFMMGNGKMINCMEEELKL
jgi:hypothetical protein